MQSARNLATLLPFVASIVLGLMAWGAVCLHYVWPRIRELPLQSAVRPILHFHLFRYVGLAFLVPGVVGQSLPAAFAAPRGIRRSGCPGLSVGGIAVSQEPLCARRDMGI